MSAFDYQSFYEKVGRDNGWDFSRLQVITEGETWDYDVELRNRLTRSSLLLDLGTGGGERLRQWAPHALLSIGIDSSASMIETARRNSLPSVEKVRFYLMDTQELQFPDGFFDIAGCRHAPFHAWELSRVLRPGGIFITQQVAEHDKENLVASFGRGQGFGETRGARLSRDLRELVDAGFKILDIREYDAVEYYAGMEDLLFLLKHTPILPDFGKHAGDFDILDRFIERHITDQGIRTNSARYLITASTNE